jgi:uncharacterized protein (DUF433 family)
MKTATSSSKNYWANKYLCDDEARNPWLSMDSIDLPRPKDFSLPFSAVLKNAKQLSLFVDIDPDVIGGTPRIGGTRIPVHLVLNAIDEYGSIAGVTAAYRSLTEAQIRDALRFSIHVLECPLEHEPTIAG